MVRIAPTSTRLFRWAEWPLSTAGTGLSGFARRSGNCSSGGLFAGKRGLS
ncbi:MAG: hypothetical protein M1497_05705 [Nitrospirae bacterium]|nr:hypothetical protein [Nitrospirota bacterium]